MTAEATSAPLPGKLVALAPEVGDPLPHQTTNRREPGIFDTILIHVSGWEVSLHKIARALCRNNKQKEPGVFVGRKRISDISQIYSPRVVLRL